MDEPNQTADHSVGRLLLLRVLGRLRVYRVRNLKDAAARGEHFE